MRAYSGHWLDYDPVALVILVVGIGAGAAGAEHLKKLSGERRREPLINVASSFKSRRDGVGFLYAGAEG
jgi:hypothetical protein